KEVLERMDAEEASFAQRLREVMAEKGLKQEELAARVGIGQPAIAMMLKRTCRPQKKTILRFATAIGVSPEALWPAVRPPQDAAASVPVPHIATNNRAR